jgi:outer membrane lipoprotein LolB
LNFRCAALLAGGLLAGCAGVPPDLGATREQVGDFSVDARFALRAGGPDGKPLSSGGRLTWEHRSDSDRVLILSPFGTGIAEIESGPGGAVLRLADGRTRVEADPDALIEEVTGQRLPVRRLPYWLLGRATGVERDGSGRPLRASEAGWQIAYTYGDDAPGALPAGVTVTRGSEVELRLRLEEWRQAP